MKFKKLGDDKIKCVITHEEMEQNGIELGDFLGNQEKTQSFIRDILAEACKTLDIEPKGHAYSVQMTVMPQGDVALIISPDVTSNLSGAIDELKKHLASLQESLHDAKAELNNKKLPVADKSEDQGLTLDSVDDRSAKNCYTDTPLWCIVKDFDAAVKLCREIPKFEGMKSALYKYRGEYYIRMTFDLTRRQVSSIILEIAEYSDQMFTESFDGAFIVEHGKLICDDCARVLSEL